MRANLPSKEVFLGKSLPGRLDITIVELKGTGNDGLLFKARSDQLRRDLACKVIPRANLTTGAGGTELWRDEVHKADALKNPAVVRFEDIQIWRDDAVDCVVLVAEFVEGLNLRQFVEKNRKEVTIPFIKNWLGVMLELFYEMKQRGLLHGDLHPGNIIVEDRSAFSLQGQRYVFRVTDFGVSEATSDRRFKDDYFQLADILAQLLNAVDFQSLGPRDKYAFGIFRDHYLERHLVEGDQTRDPFAKQPEALFKKLQSIDTDFEKLSSGGARLLSPFDFLSCEQIGDAPDLLRALYSEFFLGLTEIESRNNVVVTGPRGCGKSTVFKSLSLDQRIRTENASPDKIKYIGIYYQCIDLYFGFPRYSAPSRAEAVDIPLHFVTSTLLVKLLNCVENWARMNFPGELDEKEQTISQAIWRILEVDSPKVPGADTFRTLAAELEKQRKRATKWQKMWHDTKWAIGPCFGASVVSQVCDLLVATFSFLKDRPIYFLIDDYSSPKVTPQLQMSLNRLFMQRVGSCFFKLSTESPVSFVKSDIDGKEFIEAREYVMHNLGIVYLHADSEPKLVFIEDVFKRRLAGTQVAFPAKELVELVGSDDKQNSNEDARTLRDGKKPQLWGKETLCKLCSGDIHYVIGLVGDMVKLAGGPDALKASGENFKISRAIQNKAIRDAAGSFLRNLRGVPRHGAGLVAIVEAFGNVAHSFIKFKDSKNEEGSPPHQASRIEPYEPLALGADAQKIYDELLRYSVFIEDFRGKSRRGKVVPRLFLRRFLIPHFNLTFSIRDSVELEPELFELFLNNPKEFEEKYRMRSIDSSDALSQRQSTFQFKEEK